MTESLIPLYLGPLDGAGIPQVVYSSEEWDVLHRAGIPTGSGPIAVLWPDRLGKRRPVIYELSQEGNRYDFVRTTTPAEAKAIRPLKDSYSYPF